MTTDEALTDQFYAWEKRGRGWQVFEYPVVLEPAFRPFLGHYVTLDQSHEDARRPSFFGGMLEALRGETQRRALPEPENPLEIEEPEPELFLFDGPLVEIEIGLPPDLKVTRERAVQLLTRLAGGKNPVSFEIIGVADSVSLQVVCGGCDGAQAWGQIPAFFPESVLREREHFLETRWNSSGPETALVDFGLSREFMIPVRLGRDFDVDPFIPLVAALGELGSGEIGIFQVLFEAVRNPWGESILRAVTDGDGRSFFADAPELVSRAREKVAQPLFAAIIRIAARAKTEERAWEIARNVAGALPQFSSPATNEFIPLTNDGYPDKSHEADLLGRTSCRSGMLLNADELGSLVHFPSASVKSPKFKREHKKTKAAPETTLGHELVLGENYHAGKTVTVSLSRGQRVRHTYLIGASGTGKSTLLLNLIVQDIEHGEGVAVLDPHGDLIDEVLLRIPEHRLRDVILFDPADEEYAIGFNILDAHSDLEKTLLSSDLVGVFRRLSTSWGDQMTSVLGNAILAFLESSRGGTLGELRRFLVDPEYRASFLTTVSDAEVVYYWKKEFPLLSGRPQAPILTRLDTFLRPKLIRHMVRQKDNRMDFAAIMNEGKIVLAKLAQGAIGEENSFLLGSLLVSKFHQLAIARQSMREGERRDFYLYIDEFHNFVTPSLASILSGARKYRIGLTLAHQELRQLASRDADVASAVLSNPCTRVCFRVGDSDAKRLEDGFTVFDAKDLQNLGVGEAICRIERADWDFNLRTIAVAPPPVDAAERRDRTVEHSRETYASRREDIEESMAAGTKSSSPEQRAEQKVRLDATGTAPKARRAGPQKQPADESAAGSQIVATSGRGGDHHKYLQQLIKRWAEVRGYAVTIEKPILDGLGSVDVALEKGSRRIACEVSVTTNAEHEIQNAQKCLAAGFEEVILVSSEKKVLTAARHALVSVLSSAQYRQLKFLAPEELFSYLEGLEAKGGTKAAVPDAKELVTAKEIAELLCIDVKTVYSYVQKGLLPYVKIQSNVRFLKSEVLKWMEERQYKPVSRSPHK